MEHFTLVQMIAREWGETRSAATKQMMDRLTRSAAVSIEPFRRMLADRADTLEPAEVAVICEAVSNTKDGEALSLLLGRVEDRSSRVREALYAAFPKFGEKGLEGFRALASGVDRFHFGSDEPFVHAALRCGDVAIPFVLDFLLEFDGRMHHRNPTLKTFPQDIFEEKGEAFARELVARLHLPRRNGNDYRREFLLMCGMPAAELLIEELETGDSGRQRRAADILYGFDRCDEKAKTIPALTRHLERLVNERLYGGLGTRPMTAPPPAPVPIRKRPMIGALRRFFGLTPPSPDTSELTAAPPPAHLEDEDRSPFEIELVSRLGGIASARGRRYTLCDHSENPDAMTRKYLATVTAPLVIAILDEPHERHRNESIRGAARCLTEIAIVETEGDLVERYRQLLYSLNDRVRAEALISLRTVIEVLRDVRDGNATGSRDDLDRSEEAKVSAARKLAGYGRLGLRLFDLLEGSDEIVCETLRTFLIYDGLIETAGPRFVSILRRFAKREDELGVNVLHAVLAALQHVKSEHNEAIEIAIALLERPVETRLHNGIVGFLGTRQFASPAVREALKGIWLREDIDAHTRHVTAQALAYHNVKGDWLDETLADGNAT